jgi:hypothetical protein
MLYLGVTLCRKIPILYSYTEFQFQIRYFLVETVTAPKKQL